MMPYMEQNDLYAQTIFANKSWWFGDDEDSTVNRDLYKLRGVPYVRCPVSPCPLYSDASDDPGGYLRPTYTCIMGSDQHSSTDTTAHNGPVSAGGILVLRGGVRPRMVTDGLSNTIMVGETSDFGKDSSGVQQDILVDNNRGFHMGTSYIGKPKGPGSLSSDPGGQCMPHSGGITNCTRCYNSTTVRYAFNSKAYNDSVSAGLGGNGCNRPIQSAHTGGANVLFGDGHVLFIAEGIDLAVFKNLADRDDGNPVVIP